MLKLRNMCILREGKDTIYNRPLPTSNGKFVLNSNEARVGSTDMVPFYIILYERSSLLYHWNPRVDPRNLCYVWYCCTRTLSSENLWILRNSSIYLHSCRVCYIINF